MSLLPRSLWKIFQLMVSNAKEPSRKLAGVSSLLSVHLLHWKCFRSEYLKQDIIWFYLHFSDYDWSGYFFSVYFLLAFPSLWMFYSYIKGPLKKKSRISWLLFCYFFQQTRVYPTGAEPWTTSGIQILSETVSGLVMDEGSWGWATWTLETGIFFSP